MNQIEAQIRSKWSNNRELLRFSLIATLIWGLVAHGYYFFNYAMSNDSLNEFNAAVFGNVWKMQLGRVLTPVYRYLTRGMVTLPWLVGLLSLMFIGLTVFVTVKIFKIRSRFLIVLAAGIFTCNQTTTALVSGFINDIDSNMFAVLLAVVAVWLWDRYSRGFLYGIIPLGICIGIYQSFICLTITLVLIRLIMALLEHEDFQASFIKGVKAVVMLIGGGILYFIMLKIAYAVSGVALVSDEYNSVTTFASEPLSRMLFNAVKGYGIALYKLVAIASIQDNWFVYAVNGLMIAVAGFVILRSIFSGAYAVREILVILILIVLLPLAMNLIYLLSGGVTHDLTRISLWLVHLFVLLIAQWQYQEGTCFRPGQKQIQRGLLISYVCVLLWGSVLTANAVHLKKDLEKDANLAFYSRVTYKIEDYDGYVPGETPVVFAGNPAQQFERIPGFEDTYRVTGSVDSNVLRATTRDRYEAYYSYVLQVPMIIAEEQTWNTMLEDPAVMEMPAYPNDDCIAMIDGVLVVKLGQMEIAKGA